MSLFNLLLNRNDQLLNASWPYLTFYTSSLDPKNLRWIISNSICKVKCINQIFGLQIHSILLFVFRGNRCPRQMCLLLLKRVTNSIRTEVTNKRRKMIWWTLERRLYVRVCLPAPMREADAAVQPQQPSFRSLRCSSGSTDLPLKFTASSLYIAETAAASAIIQNTGICFQAHIYGLRRMEQQHSNMKNLGPQQSLCNLFRWTFPVFVPVSVDALIPPHILVQSEEVVLTQSTFHICLIPFYRGLTRTLSHFLEL